MSRKRRRENIGEDKDDSNDGKDAPGGRTLKALREGKGRKTQMTPAKQRYSIKLKTIAAFKNMPRGEVGILVVLPVGKGDLIFEHTNTIPPGVLVSVLEALQQEMPDYRIEEALEEYKAVQVAVERRGASKRTGRRKERRGGTQRGSKRQRRAAHQESDEGEESEEESEEEEEDWEDPLGGLGGGESDMQEEETDAQEQAGDEGGMQPKEGVGQYVASRQQSEHEPLALTGEQQALVEAAVISFIHAKRVMGAQSVSRKETRAAVLAATKLRRSNALVQFVKDVMCNEANSTGGSQERAAKQPGARAGQPEQEHQALTEQQQALVGAAVKSFQLAMGADTSICEQAIAAVQTATGMPNSAALQRCVQAAMEGPVDAAGHHGEGAEMPSQGLQEQAASGGEAFESGAAGGGAASAGPAGVGKEISHLGPQAQDASGNCSPDAPASAGEAAAALHTAAAAAATATSQQQRAAEPAADNQRPRRAGAAAGVFAAVCALEDDEVPSKVQKRKDSGKKASSTPPTGYTVAGLAGREKQLWNAKDKDRAAIVKKWEEEAGSEDAPVAELVSAAKFAVALADCGGTKPFRQQASILKNYMQNSPKFGLHFSAGP